MDELLGGAEEEELTDALRRGGIGSFPHTALAFAGPLQSRVVDALYRSGVRRVIALGVLHSGGSRAYRRALDDQQPEDARRTAAAEVAGGWLSPNPRITTPFGDLLSLQGVEDRSVPVRVDSGGLLADEFSLDTFLSLMRRAADLRGVRPLPILPLYVGLTRDPIDRTFAAAERLAAWIRTAETAEDGQTAIVTTGDLVHYGTAYGQPEADPSEPLDELTGRLRSSVEQMLDAGLRRREWALAYRLSLEALHNDQREILAVLSGILGPARARIHHFELSDYADTLGVPPPCRVASALVVYEGTSDLASDCSPSNSGVP